MICGFYHQGSGLGNQLFRYVTTRSLAADKGWDWGMLYVGDGSGKEEGFKGQKLFLNNCWGVDILNTKPPTNVGALKIWREKKVVDEHGVDIRSYDPEINFVQDNTIIDGEFQDMRYWGHRLAEIDTWLAVNPLHTPDNLVAIGFRGGEYSVYPDLYLPRAYWAAAINSQVKGSIFEVHTDDPQRAHDMLGKLLPKDTPFIHDIDLNWRTMRYAPTAIIANSSFYILPRLLNKGVTYAPRYWARHNTKTWALPQNYYPAFTYL